MSGSSGFSFGGSTALECDKISIRTQLASPDPDVVKELGKGDILQIVLATATGPLQAVTNDGAIAGAILTSDPGMLIGCMNDGNKYQARVLDVDGGDCEVLIYYTPS